MAELRASNPNPNPNPGPNPNPNPNQVAELRASLRLERKRDSMVAELAERGWEGKRAVAALEKNGWVVEAAIKSLQK